MKILQIIFPTSHCTIWEENPTEYLLRHSFANRRKIIRQTVSCCESRVCHCLAIISAKLIRLCSFHLYTHVSFTHPFGLHSFWCSSSHSYITFTLFLFKLFVVVIFRPMSQFHTLWSRESFRLEPGHLISKTDEKVTFTQQTPPPQSSKPLVVLKARWASGLQTRTERRASLHSPKSIAAHWPAANRMQSTLRFLFWKARYSQSSWSLIATII